jgi:hypothetical protein
MYTDQINIKISVSRDNGEEIVDVQQYAIPMLETLIDMLKSYEMRTARVGDEIVYMEYEHNYLVQ